MPPCTYEQLDLDLPGTYMVVCHANGMFYIGRANRFESRKKTHFKRLKRNCHWNPIVQACFNKYGEDSFEFVPLKVWPIEWLHRAEELLLCQWKRHPLCMNISEHSSTPYGPLSEERKERIRKKNTGQKRTPEQKERIRVANKEAWVAKKARGYVPPKRVTSHEAWNKGKPWSEETRKKQSDSHKGKPWTEAQRKGQEASQKPSYWKGKKGARSGQKNSEEHNQRISEAHKGKKHPPLQVTRMKETKARKKAELAWLTAEAQMIEAFIDKHSI